MVIYYFSSCVFAVKIIYNTPKGVIYQRVLYTTGCYIIVTFFVDIYAWFTLRSFVLRSIPDTLSKNLAGILEEMIDSDSQIFGTLDSLGMHWFRQAAESQLPCK